ncbi:MAG: 4-hydroxy-tetrahydrodipicolinate reductase [Alphaproteobacteria bacterium]|nr:4-hydroxy-tetrahydrodipicolinate reductase [Alphaproteobacteria bacterium]
MKIGIVGCAGRMGQMLGREVMAAEGARLIGGTECAGHKHLGQDLGRLLGTEPHGHPVTEDAKALFARADVVLDFTVPAASVAHAKLAARAGKALVIGTTGLSGADEAAIRAAARRAPIVYAGNMGTGINLLLALVEQVAKALGPDYDIEIVEMHHRHKIDAPSGTALMLGRAAARGRGIEHDANIESGRHGHTGARKKGAIGYAALRGGEVIGEHSVIFAGADEHLEIRHRAFNRRLFASGAVRAALWVADRKPGLYTMFDVLGLSGAGR